MVDGPNRGDESVGKSSSSRLTGSSTMPDGSPFSSSSYGSSIAISVLSYRNPPFFRIPIVWRLCAIDGPRAPTGRLLDALAR